MIESNISRRCFLTSSAGLILSSCGKTPEFKNAMETMGNIMFGFPDPLFGRDDIRKLPYATIRAKLGKGPRVIMLLARYDGEKLHWVSSDRNVIVTQDGLVVRTVGLPDDLAGAQLLNGNPLAQGLHHLTAPMRATRIFDYGESTRSSIQIESVFEPAGRETIEIMDLKFDTVVVRERAVAREVNWTFENYHWLDPESGRIWKSRQTINRTLPPLLLEVLKPAA